MVKLIAYALWTALLLSSQSVWAQQELSDPIGENFFPPELIMQHQQAIGLDEDQKDRIRGEVLKVQARFTELQWKLQDEMETMASLLKQERVVEQQVLAELDKVLDLERDIKRTQFALLVRIKNILTPEQQEQLQEMKRKLRGELLKQVPHGR